ncbi:PREDICTED: zinc finger C2HC domain-containing protein 1C-like [Ceratosolen solmsi marchali]|uniref:Zinc finger C2HC domain-containing protein 1C-like n=1 Tax=Ceratosolen solmsi marchali TaxID=326594 RepID=A0AAJ6VLS2_9HYME|nr:PREDICTED: zinc finger C2HC domain-containing protein 1C-like [Ceratosolen solmsi marchali]
MNIKSVSRVEPEPHIVKSNWRRKHEDFINAIRSAKQMQVHLASGGKLSDLAISPPSDNSDYVKCPHCSRRFSQTVASRHIPKCNSMQSNKPGLRNTFKAKH